MANYTGTMAPGQAGKEGKGVPNELTQRGMFKFQDKGEAMKAIYFYNDTKVFTGVLYVPVGETVTSITIAI